jgi:phosphate:Na+ symporter
LRAVLQSLADEPVIAMLVAALLTWACHSSIAVVLLIVSLATTGVVDAPGALALVLGANLGGTLPALFDASTPVARRLPLGNLLVRGFGCLVCLPLLHPIAHWLAPLGASPARIVVNFHTAFNLALALLFILPVERFAQFLVRCCRSRRNRPIRRCRNIWILRHWIAPTWHWRMRHAKRCACSTWSRAC